MLLCILLGSLTLHGLASAATMRSNRNQNFDRYEIQTFQTSGPASPLANIIGAIANPINVLAERLTRQPEPQHGGHFGPPGHFGLNGPHRPPPRHHGPPGHHGHHHPQPPPPSFNPFLPFVPPRDESDNYPRQPGLPFSQGQFPQTYDYFSQGQNYPKPGFSRYPGNKKPNQNECIGFCETHQLQPQPPQNQFSNSNFGGFSNNAQQIGFGGFGSNGNQMSQPPQQTNPFGSYDFNNNQNGVSNNVPQANNNGFRQNRPSQENGLVQTTFGGFGSNGNRIPQSQATNQFGNNFSGTTNNQQSNNGLGKPESQSQGNGLIESTFGGFAPGQNRPMQPQSQGHISDGLISSTFGGFHENPQANKVPVPTNPSDSNGLIDSIFKNPSPEKTQSQNPTSEGNGLIISNFQGFGADGTPNSLSVDQSQFQPSNPTTNNSDDLVSNVFGGFPNKPNTPNSDLNSFQSNSGGDLIEGVFPGFDSLAKPTVNVQPTSDTNAEMKANNDLIESIFAGVGDNSGQTDFIGTSTAPPSTTNSNGLIYDIDVRSS